MRIAMVAADYTPGEADQLRRDMAAWRRSTKLEGHRDRLVSRMVAKGIEPEFAERVFKQISGFGEYGFPESHAASFALISYAAAYLRRHYPAEFSCGLLNAQPMGFYSIATLVDDAKRQGVEVRPIDVLRSRWHCTLEEAAPAASGDRRFAIRMGLRFVKGLREEDTGCLKTPGIRALAALAEAGAFEGSGRTRRGALWEAPDLVRDRRLSLPFEDDSAPPAFDPLSEHETIAWDYRAASHSVRGHPLAPLRPQLRAKKLLDASEVRNLPAGARARYAGLVICRQRPPTAKNVTFMTLEDETGFVNLVVWQHVFKAFAVIAKTAWWLGVTGTIQREQGVVHLIARRLWIPRDVVMPEPVASRDFH